MKTRTLFSFVNLQKKTNIMKSNYFPKTVICTLALSLLSLIACQKDAVAPDTFDTTTAVENKPLYAVNDITDIAETGRLLSSLTTRGDLADIEDTPVITTGSTINCIGTPYQCASSYLEFLRTINAIKPGQRLGVYDALALTGNSRNDYECYTQHTQVGVMQLCGYKGKDKDHPLHIKTTGNYRVQLTPKYNDRNLDMFIYKHTVRPNGKIDTTVVAMSTMSEGQTETVHLTEEGFYTIVVDSKTSSPHNTDYILAVSNNTPVKTIPIVLIDNTLVYQFTAPSTSYKMLYGWNFKRKISGVLTDLGTYPANYTFRFSCETCDYLVSPVYYNTHTGHLEEGDATVVRP